MDLNVTSIIPLMNLPPRLTIYMYLHFIAFYSPHSVTFLIPSLAQPTYMGTYMSHKLLCSAYVHYNNTY